MNDISDDEVVGIIYDVIEDELSHNEEFLAEQRRIQNFNDFVGAIKYICGEYGFNINNPLELTERETGKKYIASFKPCNPS